jgi:hypothetical protein
MALITVAKTLGSPTYQRYEPISLYYAVLRDLSFRSAALPSELRTSQWGRMGENTPDAFLANDSGYNDIRRLREYPRLTLLPDYSYYIPPPEPLRQPFYLFVVSGKGWEIWKLRPEVFELLEPNNNHDHLCVLIARSATDDEIHFPSRLTFTDAFFRKSGQISFYDFYGLYSIFYPIEGLNGEIGYLNVKGRYMDLTGSILSGFLDLTYPVVDEGVLVLPHPSVFEVPPSPQPPVHPNSRFLLTKPAILAHYEGLPMNGKVVAPQGVTSGQITLQIVKSHFEWVREGITLRLRYMGDTMEQPIQAPKISCGIWALPSEDPNAKLEIAGYYYSLNDVGAELVEQYVFDFFEPQVTFKVASRDNKCLYVGMFNGYHVWLKSFYALRSADLRHPVFLNKTPDAEVVAFSGGGLKFTNVYRHNPNYGFAGTTPFSFNYMVYAPTGDTMYDGFVTSIIEGDFPPQQKNKDVRFNVAIIGFSEGYLPKISDLKVMTSFFNPTFVSSAPVYRLEMGEFVGLTKTKFTLVDLNERVVAAPVSLRIGGIEWIYDVIPFNLDMPIGVYEILERLDLGAADSGYGRETVKVLVWQPMWFSHSFTTDPNYGDTLMQFGWKITTIASPPRVEYVTGGIMVASAWFQNLLKRLRGTELKDAEKQLLRDCVCSLDGFFGAIRVTFHYDKQTGLIYMREWRLGVPFGDPVPLTTFRLQPYHEIRALKDFWSWSLYLDIIDTRTETIVKRIRIVPTIRGWVVGEVNPNQPIAFTQRKSFANPLVGVNPSSPYTVDRNLGFVQVVGRNPHALIGATLTNINPQVYRHESYPTRFYPLQAPITSLRGIPTQYQTAAQKFYGSQVPVAPIQFGNLNAQPIYVASIPIVLEARAKRDVPYEIIAKWGVGVAIFAAGTQWANLLPYGLADLGELLHWTVIEFWEEQP